MLARGSREVRAKVIPNVKRETLQNEILSRTWVTARTSSQINGLAITRRQDEANANTSPCWVSYDWASA
jgi:hypothetical protein